MLLNFFSKNISVYARFDDQRLNDTLTNDIVSFEQLGQDLNILYAHSGCSDHCVDMLADLKFCCCI